MNVNADQVEKGGCTRCQEATPPTYEPPPPAPKPPAPAVVVVNDDHPSWITIALVDDEGMPVPFERYRVVVPDGTVIEGNLDVHGRARVEGIEDGECKVTFPELDEADWKRDGA